MRPILIGLVAAFALAGAASAQPQQQQGGPDLGRLHDALHLSSDQDSAWRQYLQAMNGNGQMMAQRQSAERMMPQLQTPRRLALMEATMSQELASFRQQSAAVTAFYNRLTPDQQRTFDRETLPTQQGG